MDDKKSKPLTVIKGGFDKTMKDLKDARDKYELGEHNTTIETVNLYAFTVLNKETQKLFVGLTPFISVKETIDALADAENINILEYQQVYDFVLSFYQNRFFDEYTITYEKNFKVSEVDEARLYLIELNDKHLNKQ